MATTDVFLEWSATANEPPATGYATLGFRNGHPGLEFDAAVTESAIFVGRLPASYGGGGLTVDLDWIAATATTGNVRWATSFERMNTDLDADSFATANEANGAANATSGIITRTSIAHTVNAQIDGLVAGEPFRLRVQRIGGDATNDTMTGDAQLRLVTLRET